MGAVSVADWKAFSRAPDGDAAVEALYARLLGAAEFIVADYLGYALAQASYTHTFKGEGRDYIQLKARPVTDPVTAVTVDGVSKTPGDYFIDEENLVSKSGEVFASGAAVVVQYQAGWAAAPDCVQIAIMEIATLKYTQAAGQIGVTSQSMDGGNSRTFVNFTDFSKYLAPLQSLRVVRLKEPGK